MLACAGEPAPPPQLERSSLVDEYLERYFRMFPTRATDAGRHELDDALEDLSRDRRHQWLEFNRTTAARLEEALQAADLDRELALDFELLWRQAERQILEYEILKTPLRSPLYWTGTLGSSTLFLLVRDDLPLEQRLTSAAARARLIPRLAAQAREALSEGRADIAAEPCQMAARQAAGTARFYREGFVEAAGENKALRQELQAAGLGAAEALGQLADFLDSICKEAEGSVRLAANYPWRFRLVTGLDEPVDDVLRRAELDLTAKKAETASYGRQVWPEIFPGQAAPEDDDQLVRRLFDRIAEDGATTIEEYVVRFKKVIDESVEFVRTNDLVTLPEPLTLHTDRSPSFFVGASVGGVYPAGPYAPRDAKTLLFVPTPPDSATDEQKRAFFRDFNDHFTVMITPHEIIPGHYLQLKFAAAHPHRVRALFADGVYVEGWGTFCERLMLDQGWGGPLPRLAHLKKQLENIARTIVDIRVHTRDMTREEVLAFVQEEAFQDVQFAGNMWRRSITSAPQLTTYYLGYGQVRGLFDDVKSARGDDFRLREFMDGMMELGPVPVRHYRERMLGQEGSRGE